MLILQVRKSFGDEYPYRETHQYNRRYQKKWKLSVDSDLRLQHPNKPNKMRCPNFIPLSDIRLPLEQRKKNLEKLAERLRSKELPKKFVR